jgi:hypothetical protein
MTRTPDEILAVLDQAQKDLDLVAPGDYDLRSLLWEIFTDVLGILADDRTTNPYLAIEDFLTNFYGDD